MSLDESVCNTIFVPFHIQYSGGILSIPLPPHISRMLTRESGGGDYNHRHNIFRYKLQIGYLRFVFNDDISIENPIYLKLLNANQPIDDTLLYPFRDIHSKSHWSYGVIIGYINNTSNNKKERLKSQLNVKTSGIGPVHIPLTSKQNFSYINIVPEYLSSENEFRPATWTGLERAHGYLILSV